MKNSSDTLEELTSILDELRDRPEDAVILVEGQKDRGALIALGIGGEVWHVQGGGSMFSIAENLARQKKKAIILTDWDRKGGQLCHLIRESLKANGVSYDDILRMRLVNISKKDIKDIESLP
ncbi:MAG: Toprim subdomain protein, partial [Methanomassiliicoccales archaeon]|nr:Toprim subdomain protein [Methanomassiliicoccales archaeon]